MEIMTYLKVISKSPLPKTLSGVGCTLEIFNFALLNPSYLNSTIFSTLYLLSPQWWTLERVSGQNIKNLTESVYTSNSFSTIRNMPDVYIMQ